MTACSHGGGGGIGDGIGIGVLLLLPCPALPCPAYGQRRRERGLAFSAAEKPKCIVVKMGGSAITVKSKVWFAYLQSYEV